MSLPCKLACLNTWKSRLYFLKHLGTPRINAIWHTTFQNAWWRTGYL